MAQDILLGLVAGAAGTAVLNIVTYLDMMVRGRAESDVPAKVAGTLLHVPNVTSGQQHRRSALGALSGYVVGLGIGLIYGVIRSQISLASWGIAVAGLVIGLAAAG